VFSTVRLTIRRGRIAEKWCDAADRIAVVAAAIWLVHPVQTEAVDYVSQRTELLVSFFYMTTLYCAIRAWESAARRWYVAAVAACALGMGSKEVMLTAPIATILYDRAFLFDSWRGAWRSRSRRAFYLALIMTSAISILLIARGGRDATVGFGLGMTWYEYFYSQCWAIAHYLRLVLWPNGLTYDYGQAPVRDLSGVPGAIGLTLLGVATLIAWRRPDIRWLAFLGSWFFLLLAPSSSFVAIQTEIAAERRIYLALAAVFVLVAVALEWLRRARPRRIVLGAYALGAVLYAGMLATSFERSSVYRTPELLWRDAVNKQPVNARALNGVAAALLKREPNDLSEPDSLLARALAADSTLVLAWRNRAVIAIHTNRLADAESFLRHGLAIAPGDSALNEQLGAVLLARGKPELAAPYLERVTRVFPNAKSLTELGTAYLASGRLDSAIVALRRATELDSTYVDALNYIGGALVESDRGSEAIPYLLRSVHQDSGTGFSLGLLCLAYGESHQADLASQVAAAAVARDPSNSTAYLFAGRGLQAAGRLADAEKYLAGALHRDPNDPQSLTRLGMVEAALGKTADARHHIRRALELAPDYSLAIQAEKTLPVLR
jgi:tetratricopeptide (TPR) repeat protein